MTKLLVLFFIIIFSSAVYGKKEEAEFSPREVALQTALSMKVRGKEKGIIRSKLPSSTDRYWIQNGCTLYKFGLEAKTYPGEYCIFLKDGSFISATGTSMKRISPALEVLWELPGHFHHQVNLSADGERILTLSESLMKQNGETYRDGEFVIIDLNGKVLRRKRPIELLSSIQLKPFKWLAPPHIQAFGQAYEGIHFNSIYEVPKNIYSASTPWLKEGNIVVNGLVHGILFLSPDMSRVLKRIDYPYSEKNYQHDVQITPEGQILIFNNWTKSVDSIHSSIDSYDPVKNVRTVIFEANPPEIFYSSACGGVQKIGDLVFFSHITNGGYLWSLKDKKLIWAYPGTRGDLLGLEVTQQLKLVDVEDFLKNSK